MRTGVALFLAAAAAALVASRCDTVYDVTFTLSDAAAARGFLCADDGGYLVDRLNAQSVNVVMDVVDVGSDVLSCRPTTIVDHCSTHSCFLRQRACYTVQVDPTSAESVLAQVDAQLKLQHAALTDIPTDREVIVRLAVTSQRSCDASQPLDPAQVGGCVYSCPTRLDTNGTLDLDLDVPAFAPCDLAVAACATFPN